MFPGQTQDKITPSTQYTEDQFTNYYKLKQQRIQAQRD